MTWPMTRGAPEHSGGQVPHFPSNPPRVAWSVSAGNRGLGAPLISVNRVVCSALRESGAVLLGLDRRTGGQIWELPFEVLPACYWSSGVVVERRDLAVQFDDEVARLVRLDDGAVVLEKSLDSGCFATSPATIAGDRLYVGMVNRLVCMDASSLTTLWSFSFSGAHVVYAAPTLLDDRLFVHAVSATGTELVALGALDGKVGWSVSLAGVARATATGAEGRLYLPIESEKRELIEIDALTGRLLWSTLLRETRELAVPSAIEDGVESADGLVFASLEGSFVAIDIATHQFAWRSSDFPNRVSAAVVAGGVGYLAGTDGELVSWDPQTGALLWRHQLEGPVVSSPSIGEDGLVIMSASGRVTAISVA